MQHCYGLKLSVLTAKSNATPVSEGHCVVCLVERDVPDEARQLYVDYAHISIADASVAKESFS